MLSFDSIFFRWAIPPRNAHHITELLPLKFGVPIKFLSKVIGGAKSQFPIVNTVLRVFEPVTGFVSRL